MLAWEVCFGLKNERLQNFWQGKKDSNLRMPESKSGALTSLAIPLHRSGAVASTQPKTIFDPASACCLTPHWHKLWPANPQANLKSREGENPCPDGQTLHCQSLSSDLVGLDRSTTPRRGRHRGTKFGQPAASNYGQNRMGLQRSPRLYPIFRHFHNLPVAKRCSCFFQAGRVGKWRG
jgi:hypothetical protein